jgi:hypothetical protein
MKKVTGVGGIFFMCDDPEKMRNWYSANLGLITNEHESLFEFRNANEKEKINYLQWSPFAENTNYFAASKKEFMINYCTENLVELVAELKNQVQLVEMKLMNLNTENLCTSWTRKAIKERSCRLLTKFLQKSF